MFDKKRLLLKNLINFILFYYDTINLFLGSSVFNLYEEGS